MAFHNLQGYKLLALISLIFLSLAPSVHAGVASADIIFSSSSTTVFSPALGQSESTDEEDKEGEDEEPDCD